ncbi:DUF2244 domain-containing protein [Massilia sp. YIM B04103]|uniref:DUF2244 domain-containing protein n=1 Tax=Massilia sp. YIM B04103 TaxID=2963106 RepID=UPI00210CBC1C
MPPDPPLGQREWLLRRNCSLTPRQMGAAFAVLCLMSLAVAAIFIAQGVWQILLFTALELTAVAVAFLCYARHAADYEQIVLSQGSLLVRKVVGGREALIRLDPDFIRIEMPRQPGDLIHLHTREAEVAVGYFATEKKRRELANELRRELQGGIFN